MANKHFKIGKGLTVEGVTARPSDPQNGDIIFRSDTQVFEQYTNGVWSAIGSGSGSGAIEGVFAADGNLLKGQVVQITADGAGLYFNENRLGISKVLGLVKEDATDTNPVTVVFGGTFDIGVAATYTEGYDYFAVNGGSVDVYGSSNIQKGVPLFRVGTALSDQILNVDFAMVQDHDYAYDKDFNLFNYGQATSNLETYNPFINYKDAAAALPVDGTGGSPTVAQAPVYVSTNVFQGNSALSLVKTAANGQGEGWSFDVSVPLVSRTKVHTIQFDYLILTGTFNPGTDTTTGDVNVYFYDVTNSTLVQPAGFKLTSSSSTITGKVSAEFQIPAGCQVGRVILHIASTNTTAFTMLVDNIKVVPNKVNLGAVVTDWKTETITGSWVTNTTYSCKSRRVGDQKEYDVTITLAGAPNAVALTLTLPNGETLDTTKLASNDGLVLFGIGQGLNAGNGYNFQVGRQGLNNGVGIIYQSATNGSQTAVSSTNPVTWAAGNYLRFRWMMPITGLSSNLVLSQDTSTRIVAARLENSAATLALNNTAPTLIFPIVAFDTTGSYNTTNGQYTVPVPGFYSFTCQMFTSAYTVAQSQIAVSVFRNGVFASYIGQYRSETATSHNASFSGATVIRCNAGDVLTFRGYSDAAITTLSLVNSCGVTIERISGPEQIAASETVAARYFSTASAVINTTPTNYLPPTKDYDTHNSYNSSTGYSIPVSGIYEIKTQFITTIYSTTSTIVLRIQKNAVNQAVSTTIVPSGASGNYCVETSCRIRCLQGDIIKNERVMTAGSTTEDGLAPSNFFEIIKVGN